MPACDEVKLLLGPFDDGELEPHEMEDVALHVVSCTACKAALEDYRSLGVALRDCSPKLEVEGFTAAVLKRIDQIPRPLRIRLRHYLDDFAVHLRGVVPLVAAGALAALLTGWFVTPYAQRLLHHSPNIVQLAAGERHHIESPQQHSSGGGQDVASDESEASMITLSDDPTTTVIWLPNQP